MRVAITGATGNAGTSLLHALVEEPAVDAVVGIARRAPELPLPKVSWAAADVATTDLRPLFSSCDAVVHLAWLIQPSRDEAVTYRVNVEGSRRVFEAAAAAGVRALVYASSLGAYAPGPKDTPVAESWPAEGVATSFYSRQKAAVEAMLDRFAAAHPRMRVVRLRPALTFKAAAASEIRRLFAGPLLPSPLVAPARIPVVPHVPGLRFQAVHSDDVADAYRRVLISDASGAYNIAADPVLDTETIAKALDKPTVTVPPRALRSLATLTWKLRLQPTPSGWLDMGMQVPVMDASRARRELGWRPRHSSLEALVELLEGMSREEGWPTPPLAPGGAGPLRVREFLAGVGAASR